MSTPSKRKGDEHERRIATYLVEQGWVHAERRKAGATLDKGDLYGILGVCIEAKNEKRIDLAGYMKELEVEMKNDKATTGVVVHKKKGTTDVGAWYATMPVSVWYQLLKKAGY